MKKIYFLIFLFGISHNHILSSEKTEDFDKQLEQIRQNTNYCNHIKYERKEKKRKESGEALEQALLKNCNEINKLKQQKELEIEKLQQHIASDDQTITLMTEMLLECRKQKMTAEEYK